MAPSDLVGFIKFNNFIGDLVFDANLHVHTELHTE